MYIPGLVKVINAAMNVVFGTLLVVYMLAKKYSSPRTCRTRMRELSVWPTINSYLKYSEYSELCEHYT